NTSSCPCTSPADPPPCPTPVLSALPSRPADTGWDTPLAQPCERRIGPAIHSPPEEEPVTTTSDQLREQLKTMPYGYTYDAIPIFELGEAAEEVITIGHVDKAAFAKAYDAYLEEVYGDDRYESQRFTIEQFTAEAEYRQARIHRMEEFPLGEFEVVFDKAGDV